MALSDYYLCDVCQVKVFYDTDLIRDNRFTRVGDLLAICIDCAKEYRVAIINKETNEEV